MKKTEGQKSRATVPLIKIIYFRLVESPHIGCRVDHLNDAKVVLTNLCCDNAAANSAALHILGAALLDSDRLKVTIDKTNVVHEPIFVVFDTSHLIKLARNTLGDLQLLWTEDGRRIEWNHIMELEKLQSAEKLHLANKLTKQHVQYTKQKMRVYLATQVLSASVADAIEFCDKDLKLRQFSESDGTCEYLRIFNMAFDLLDSKVNFSRGTKMPLKMDNKTIWTGHFEQIEKYVRGLHHVNPSIPHAPSESGAKRLKRDMRVVAGVRKKGFLGFLINMKSYSSIFEKYVEEKQFLVYLLGHKLSQDHLESLFGTIRSSLGLNNNPTVIQGCLMTSLLRFQSIINV
jgi:hypothetical protein